MRPLQWQLMPASPDTARPRQSSWSRWRRTSWSERGAFAAGAVLIPLVSLSLRTIGVRRTLAWSALGRGTPAAAADEEEAIVRTTVLALRRARAHGLWSGTCLSRSIALRWLLARRGVATELRFGAQREAGRFEAHAWLEREGVPIDESPDVLSRMHRFRPAGGGRDPAAGQGGRPAP
jgi:Transglutaminase-like superfamily